MIENDNLDVFNAEFRHEVVREFIKDLASGAIQLPWPNDLNTDTGKTVLTNYANLKDNIEKYVSGKLTSEGRNDIESEIFSMILLFRLTGTKISKYVDLNISKEIERVDKKIDATNTLLRQILLILSEVAEKLDKQ
ncbi:MAG: hypothetical protein R2685_03985 [Candidatus Nitrosocosmicus sp.]|nr:hypothetical protein [Candidatus Nitrosocosmicus sp.]